MGDISLTMEIKVKVIEFKFVIAILLFAVSGQGNAIGQDADANIGKAKQLAQGFNEIRTKEFVPLEKKSTEISNLF